jgi:KDO2-lipid IV(A) lauroyltransferase
LYYLLKALSFLFRLMPTSLALATGQVLGWVWYFLIPVRRKVAWNNIRRCLPELPPKEHRNIARRCFSELAKNAVEFLRFPALSLKRIEKLIEYDGLEHLASALAQGRGVVGVSAHFGNFDLAICSEALRGIPVVAITRQQSSKGVNRFWMEIRQKTGLELLPAKGSALKIGRALRKKKAVAIVIDQHMPEGRGINVPFFGRPAATIHAPAILALAAKCPILTVSIERLAHGRHRIVYDRALAYTPSGDRQKDIESITLRLNQWLEKRIRQRPDHWLWLHRRWKVDE